MMTSRTIRQYPIEPISASSPVDDVLAKALLHSVKVHGTQLHGRRVWLACSGGRDSLALAALCLQLYRQAKLPFLPQLLHVDHGLQASSVDWATHVKKWAQAQQMSCTVLQATVDGHDEQAARLARYQVMRAHINQGDVLLLAHHADDQAETVLMRLIQGAGVNGLSGMQSWRVQEAGAQYNVLWRPWLSVQRTTITAYAQRLKLPYIDDPTNDAGDNVRSGLRVHVMPLLKTYNPNTIQNIARSAQLLSDAQATLSDQAEQDLQQAAAHELALSCAQQVLNIDALHILPLHRQRQLLHHWLAQDEPLPPSKQLVDDTLALTQRNDHDHQTQLHWQGRTQQYHIRRYRQQLYRLSQTWLEWLNLPIAVHRQPLSHNVSFSPVLRTGKGYRWQLKCVADSAFQPLSQLQFLLNQQECASGKSAFSTDIKEAKDRLVLQATPLDRQQRIQTALATRPQSGKKLYQTLAIPVWLRASLVVISLVNAKTDEVLPLLLISPFESWVLGQKKSDTKAEIQPNTVISSTLQPYS
ncbi:tRNA lysidine(34) synthetase TilS [Psychrobacter coccoides]|nr:tRNA lysidine(34) synthetase TilS [Psychrobacter coccoides]